MKGEYNSKLDKNIEAFIQLRIEGKSFDEIAKALNVAKGTLIDWNKKADVKNTIDEGKAFAINEVVKTFQFSQRERLKALLELSKKINTELLSRDLVDVPADKLLQMSIANEGRILKIIETQRQIGENSMIIDFDNGDGFFNFKLDE